MDNQNLDLNAKSNNRRLEKRRTSGSWEERVERRLPRWMPAWVREYLVEILLVTAVLVAIFLLVEQWNIRVTILRWVRETAGNLVTSIGSMGTALVNFAQSLTLSDTLAIVILLGVFLIAGWRVRWRILRNEGLWNTHCPACQSVDLKRVHRRFSDRLLGRLGFPVRRYRCGKCGWKGARIYKRQSTRRGMPKPPASAAE